MNYLIFVIAAVFSILGYRNYYLKINIDTISPNKWSWLIWSFATLLETITYDMVSNDIIKSIVFYISSIACIIVTIKIWSKAEWKEPSWAEILSVTACCMAIIVWIVFQSSWGAHIMLLVALPLAFIPTYIDAWTNYKKEDCAAWKLWSISDLFVLSLIFLRLNKYEELPYAIIEFLCHVTVVVIIVLRKKKKKYANLL